MAAAAAAAADAAVTAAMKIPRVMPNVHQAAILVFTAAMDMSGCQPVWRALVRLRLAALLFAPVSLLIQHCFICIGCHVATLRPRQPDKTGLGPQNPGTSAGKCKQS